MNKCLPGTTTQKPEQIKLQSAVLLGLAVFVFTMVILAPCWASPPFQTMDLEAIVIELKKDLELTDEQADLIRPIIEQQIERRNAIFEKYRDKGRPDRREIRSEMEALQQEAETQLADILSESQMEAYRRLQEQRKIKIGRTFGKPF